MSAKIVLAAVCAAFFLAMTACYSAPIMPPVGLVFSNVDAPVQPAGEVGNRRGEATCSSLLGIIAWGDCSLHQAAMNGGISTVKHSDYTFKNMILGIYQSYTTIAYGD